MKRRWRLLAVLALALTTAAVISACGSSGGSEEAEPSPTATPSETFTSTFQGVVLDEPLAKPDFVLADMDGNEYDFLEETGGYVTLLYFGYTNCPDICPGHMADLSSVLDRAPELKDDVKVVFVTVDPDRDTAERLELWLGLFSDDFIGLRGTDEEIEVATKAALQEFWFPIEKEPFGDEGHYAVNHSAIVIAYGRDDVAQVVWPFGTTQHQYQNDLLILTNNGGNGNEG